ncbi:heme oxygenase (biliverdin-producing) [Kibdelosporangium persicum]|uniref:Biliverdin-producing heme oxygenase n=1 Tax=Kibdelosporangium persicum TaxID=2698649 RepID=A0ABX2FG25_9PSEU|nr:biliverdin-producing heme oxygenase [Kibdelosporangium persicum]NRN69830.1 Biliverdin-producing heme oxygenase [Kibdelosporangium persicum]
MSPTFSETLRAATLPVHEQANHSPYISALLGGELSVDAFAALAGQLYFVYSALEDAAEAMKDDPIAGRFVFPELNRGDALRQDMAYYFGPSWQSVITPLPATSAYCDRIREAGLSWSGGFVAHHYTRYLGDIAGGQIIRHKLRKLHGVEGPGSMFYVFDQIPSAPRFRDNYRALLNDAPWTAQERKDVIMESIRAYELNVGVFAALADEMPRYSMS